MAGHIRRHAWVPLLLTAFCASQPAPSVAKPVPSPIVYPETRREAVSDVLFGTAIADPYRWLERDLHADATVRDWADKQDSLSRRYLDGLPDRDAIRRRLSKIWNIERRGAPRERGGRLFFDRNSGLQNQNVIVLQEPGKQPRVLVDPNAQSPTGELVVRDWIPTLAGDKLLYAAQAKGADWRRLHVVDVATGHDTDLALEGIRTPGFAWAADGSGLYYTRYAAATSDGLTAAASAPAIWFHRLGEPQGADTKVFDGPPDGRLLVWPRTTDDGRWLIIETSSADGTRADIAVRDVRARGAPVPLVSGLKASWRYIGNTGGKMYFYTTSDAPLGRVVALDPAAPGRAPQVIAPQTTVPIQQAILAGDGLVLRYLAGIETKFHRFGLDGADRGEIALPPLTVVGQAEGRPGSSGLYYTLSSMVMAPTVHRVDLASGRTSVVAAPKASWNPRDFVLRRTEAISSDGTHVPITLAYRRNVATRMPRPTIIMVYGGWGLSVDVGFHENYLEWMDMGGVFAIAHIRGGGEFGDTWHRAAMKAGHLKGIEDFAAAARTLQAQGITTPRQTVAYGSSNGGMMVTATLNKYPALFGAAIPRVPVTDLVRFPQFTGAKIWIDEIGDPSSAADFPGLLQWSPLHNIVAGKPYPASMVSTADSDDRVVPMHSFKYVASLQAADPAGPPHLLRLERNAGHGEGRSTGQLIGELADLWAFAAYQTGLKIKP